MREEFRRRLDKNGRIKSGVVHFMPNCRWWPKANYLVSQIQPAGDLCNECQAKEKRA